MKIQGIIQAVKQRENGYSVKLNDSWYSAFGKSKVNEGDTVEIDFEVSEDGKWKNIKFLDKLKEADKKEMQTFQKEAREDKTASALTSYTKDIVVALIEKGGSLSPVESEHLAEQVANWYNIIKNKVE